MEVDEVVEKRDGWMMEVEEERGKKRARGREEEGVYMKVTQREGGEERKAETGRDEGEGLRPAKTIVTFPLLSLLELRRIVADWARRTRPQ